MLKQNFVYPDNELCKGPFVHTAKILQQTLFC